MVTQAGLEPATLALLICNLPILSLGGIMKHHTKDKGDIAVFEIMRDLAHKEYMILNPHTEHAPFDIVAYKSKKFYRIQVKHRKLTKHGTIEVSFRNSWNDKHGTHVHKMDKSEVDIIAVYCPNNGYCFYLNPNEFDKCVSLRINATKNKQVSGCHLAHNYSDIK